MARPKGSTNKPKADGAPKAAKVPKAPREPRVAQIGDNSGAVAPTDEQLQALHFQHVAKYEKAVETKRRADVALKNVAEAAKKDLGPRAVAEIKLAIQLKTPEGEVRVRDTLASQLRVARWAGLPVGSQADLFPEDRTPAVDRARADGKRAGLAGEHPKTPHHPSTPQAQAWLEGWHEGQAVLVGGIKTTVEAVHAFEVDAEDPRPAFLREAHEQDAAE